ncbi:hypothetical protein [Lentzea sp. NPDC003310]|uniref:hypothetical protein n=1 Tax=Lentzea sp. NPDC003310 TaxID=3154447 RepID=UPI0033ABBF41
MGKRRGAAWALATLTGAAVLEIRTTASRRKVLPHVGGDDFVGRIHLLADAVHGFSGALSLPGRRERERTAVKALEWHWKVSPPEARAWIVAVLEDEGSSIGEFIDVERS